MENNFGDARPMLPPELDRHLQDRVSACFDELLESGDLTGFLASEPDMAVREAVAILWRHHLNAGHEDFLETPVRFEVRPVFEPGQVLLDRFEIQRNLGRGGMGEVYLAFDRKLKELVAIKTVTAILASSELVRVRFIAEVQSARRVTHPNVCRIHEVFEDGQTTFFAMEYAEGILLSDLLAESTPARRTGLLIARQLAEGLHAAHTSGVVHGDFKPSNVIVLSTDPPRPVIMDFGLAQVLTRSTGATVPFGAGTRVYMAPELRAGSVPSVASDIYAFGIVGRALVPGLSLWDEFTENDARQRPESLAPAIAYFRRDLTRRYWMGSMLAIGAAGAAYGLFSGGSRRPRIEAGARILVNQFAAAAESSPGAKLVRALLLSALRQSPRIQAIADQDALAGIRAESPDERHPVVGEGLRRLIESYRAVYWIDGTLSERNGRAALSIRLHRASDRQMVAEAGFGDFAAVSALAERAAVWVRELAGESEKSFTANPALVPVYTSSSQDAVRKYFEGMERYALGDMAAAIPPLQEAIRLDARFAQAHNALALCLESLHRYDEAFGNIESAIGLASNLPEREKTWIEASYYSLVEDPVKAVDFARRNAGYYPDEPRFLRALSQLLSRVGATEEALEPIRRAVQIAPRNELYRDVLTEAVCETGRFDEALRVYEDSASQGNRNPWIETGHGLALLGLGRYPEAEACFGQVPAPGNPSMLILGSRILDGDVEGAIAGLRQEAARQRALDNAADEHQAHEFLCGCYFLLDDGKRAREHLEAMTRLPGFPPYARRLQCTVWWAGRLRDNDVLDAMANRSRLLAERWPNALTQAVTKHAEALIALRKNLTDQCEQLLLDSLGSAFTVWTLFDLAYFYLAVSRVELAKEYSAKAHARRGIILRRWFTGAVLIGSLQQAMAARLAGDSSSARSAADRVLKPWGLRNPETYMARTARALTF